MPRPFKIFSQLDYLIQTFYINSHTERQTVQIQISWLLRSQLIWIYTVCKGSAYLGSAGQWLIRETKLLTLIWLINKHVIMSSSSTDRRSCFWRSDRYLVLVTVLRRWFWCSLLLLWPCCLVAARVWPVSYVLFVLSGSSLSL